MKKFLSDYQDALNDNKFLYSVGLIMCFIFTIISIKFQLSDLIVFVLTVLSSLLLPAICVLIKKLK